MGQDKINYCERLMLPDGAGSILNFSGSDILEFSFPFSVEPDWVIENCELTVWIQNLSTKEVYQAAKRSLLEYGDFPERDVRIKKVYAPVTMCNSSFIPEVEIENLGTSEITSLDLVFQIDNQAAETFSWSGSVPASESGIITLPEIDS